MDHQAFAELLGNYGEFVGAIAVVVTLMYLALQIRQSTRSNYVNRGDIARERLFAINDSVMNHEALANLISQCRDPLIGEVSSVDQERIERFAQQYLVTFWGVEAAHRNVEMPEEKYVTFCDEFRGIVETYPGLAPSMTKVLKPLGPRPGA